MIPWPIALLGALLLASIFALIVCDVAERELIEQDLVIEALTRELRARRRAAAALTLDEVEGMAGDGR